MCENQQSPALQRCGDHARATMNALDESPGRMSRKEQDWAGQTPRVRCCARTASTFRLARANQMAVPMKKTVSEYSATTHIQPSFIMPEQLADCQPDRKNREGDTECKSHRSQSERSIVGPLWTHRRWHPRYQPASAIDKRLMRGQAVAKLYRFQVGSIERFLQIVGVS